MSTLKLITECVFLVKYIWKHKFACLTDTNFIIIFFEQCEYLKKVYKVSVTLRWVLHVLKLDDTPLVATELSQK
jgi:hypothetical protein